MEPDRAAAEARLEQLFAAHYGDLMRYAERRVGADSASDVVSAAALGCSRAVKVRLHRARRRFANRLTAADRTDETGEVVDRTVRPARLPEGNAMS